MKNIEKHLTFKNIVILLGALTVVIFCASVLPARILVLVVGLCSLGAIVAIDMRVRRKWESEMNRQIQRVTGDNERLAREVAKNRSEIAALKKTLSEAGAKARHIGRQGAGQDSEGADQRMIKEIADRLSRLGDNPAGGAEIGDDEDLMPEYLSPENLTDVQVANLVQTAIRNDRVDMFLQPIVTLPQRKARFYEMFSRIRIRKGVHLPAGRYVTVALQQDMLPAVDNLLLLRGLQYIRDTRDIAPNRAFFCNIASTTLSDPKFMGDLVEFIAENRALAPHLVFEMGQEDFASIGADALPVLSGLSHLGCRFSMDQLTSLSLDPLQMEARHIRFVKIDAAMILDAVVSIGGLGRVRRLKAEFDRLGIDVIVEKIESERQVRELLDLDIDYGQGFLFGRPEQA